MQNRVRQMCQAFVRSLGNIGKNKLCNVDFFFLHSAFMRNKISISRMCHKFFFCFFPYQVPLKSKINVITRKPSCTLILRFSSVKNNNMNKKSIARWYWFLRFYFNSDFAKNSFEL